MNTIGTMLAKRCGPKVDIRNVMRAGGPIGQFVEAAITTTPRRWN
jgi:hypothetical protein